MTRTVPREPTSLGVCSIVQGAFINPAKASIASLNLYLWTESKAEKYFEKFNRIDDYFRVRKIERLKKLPKSLPGFGVEDDMFQSYDMHPQDMNFEVVALDNETFDTMLEKTASFSPDANPGKILKLALKEITTNTIFLIYLSPQFSR